MGAFVQRTVARFAACGSIFSSVVTETVTKSRELGIMTTIRALIVDYSTSTAQSAVVTTVIDREQISKTIRQGGRAVWLDVSEEESAADTTASRDWLAQTMAMSRAMFERTLPFCDEAPVVTLGFALPIANRRERYHVAYSPFKHIHGLERKF